MNLATIPNDILAEIFVNSSFDYITVSNIVTLASVKTVAGCIPEDKWSGWITILGPYIWKKILCNQQTPSYEAWWRYLYEINGNNKERIAIYLSDLLPRQCDCNYNDNDNGICDCAFTMVYDALDKDDFGI